MGVKNNKPGSDLAAGGKNVIADINASSRIVNDWQKLQEIVNALRIIGTKIVLTQGTFDFIHIGHFLYLEKARSAGDVLIVGIDSDEKVRKRKGPDRPIVSEDERLRMLTHVRHVDLVTLKPVKMPKWHLIKLIKPDILVATKETYTPAQIKELKRYCGKVVILEPQATTSTTAKLRRLNMGLSHKIREAVIESLNETFERLTKNA